MHSGFEKTILELKKKTLMCVSNEKRTLGINNMLELQPQAQQRLSKNAEDNFTTTKCIFTLTCVWTSKKAW